MATEIIEKIQKWYISQCDGDWEHGYGISIGTLDNPGWTVHINVTKIVGENFQKNLLADDKSETNWIFCSIEKGEFIGHGDPTKLRLILETFLQWAPN
jgi:hypothetical protein